MLDFFSYNGVRYFKNFHVITLRTLKQVHQGFFIYFFSFFFSPEQTTEKSKD